MKTYASVRSLVLAFGLVGALAGCADIPAVVPEGSVTTATDDYNLALEAAQNQMLLLNIVRASKQHPMYFTALTDMKGSLTYGVSGVATKPFRAAALDKATLAITANISANPVFTIAPLSSKEFTSGMLSPIPPEIFAEFWDMGWHPEFMFYLLLQSIQEPGHPETFSNHPTNGTFDNFRNDVRDLAKNFKCELHRKKKQTPFGPPVSGNRVNLEDLAELRENDLNFEKSANGSEWQIQTEENNYTIDCHTWETGGDGKPLETREYDLVRNAFDTTEEDRGGKEKERGKMVLRSPESALYYLGEIMRYQDHQREDSVSKCNDATDCVNIRLENHECAGAMAPLLFQGRKETTGGEKRLEKNKPHVMVTYEGEAYVIPWAKESKDLQCATDESMHVLSFLSLLLAREQTGTTMPPPVGVSTLIGGK